MQNSEIDIQQVSFWEKNKHVIAGAVIAIILVAFILLPLGTPEDILVSSALIGFIGWKRYLAIAAIVAAFLVIALVVLSNPIIRDEFKRQIA